MPASTNEFLAPECFDHEIGDKTTGEKVGEIRIKPSSILWKPKGAHRYYSVRLDKFADWIVKNGKDVKK